MKPIKQPTMNYDPNLVLCGRTATQTVRLTFGHWEYRAVVTIEVGGNCKGLIVIESAVSSAYDALPLTKDRHQVPWLSMTAPNGDTCAFEDDMQEGDDFLKNMLIGAEIVSIVPNDEEAA